MSLNWNLINDFLIVARKLEQLGSAYSQGSVIILDSEMHTGKMINLSVTGEYVQNDIFIS